MTKRHIERDGTTSEVTLDEAFVPYEIEVPSSGSLEGIRRRCTRPVVIVTILILITIGAILAITVVTTRPKKGAASVASEPPESTVPLTILIQLDEKPQETGWALACQSQPVTSVRAGSYTQPNAQIQVLVHVVEGEVCILSVVDTGGDGIQDGFFEVYFGDFSGRLTRRVLRQIPDPILYISGDFTFETQGLFTALAPDSPTSGPTTTGNPQTEIPQPPTPTPGSPTFSPTILPPGSPTISPTTLPPGSPTIPPTILSPVQPSQRPTITATLSPTERDPIDDPTPPSTPSRTQRPTPRPTPRDTPETPEPTTPPVTPTPTLPSRTQRPTPRDTPSPTRKPTDVPSPRPTDRPTSPPTPLPSPEPTRPPTSPPSSEPTRLPTQNPTRRPTPPPGLPSVEVKFENSYSGLCLSYDDYEPFNFQFDEETEYSLRTDESCSSNDRTIWSFQAENNIFAGSGLIQIELEDGSLRCLAVAYPGRDQIAYPLDLLPCVESDDEFRWKLEEVPESDDLYQIVNEEFDLCIDFCKSCSENNVWVRRCEEDNDDQNFAVLREP